MKVAVLSFEYEGNTFSLTRADRGEFERRLLAFDDEVITRTKGHALAISAGCDVLEEAGFSILPIVAAHGGSGGAVTDDFYAEIRAHIEKRLREMVPVDGVFLALHGAMICENLADPEGDILAMTREIVGPKAVISASLDLHGVITEKMAANADILVGYETYPHNDVYTTGERAARLLVRSLRGEITPKLAITRINGFIPVIGGATAEGPMAEVYAHARRLEAEGEALCVSYFPVQPWLDIEDIGICGMAVTDGNAEQAKDVATRIAVDMWDRRHDCYLPRHTPEEAVRDARDLPKPVLIADATDCVGGGSSGDNAQMIAAALKVAPELNSAHLIADAPAAAAAHAAGVGARLTLTLGNSLDDRFGEPVTLEVEVAALSDGRFSYIGGPLAGPSGNMGPSALLRHQGLHIVVATHASYDYADEQFKTLGLDWRAMDFAVFKNPMNFRNLLKEGDHWIGVSGKGPTAARLEVLDWHRKARPFFPLDDFEAPPFL